MSKRTSYQTQHSIRINDRLKDLQRQLPSSCTDYFRSISQTTSPLTRLAYAYDLRLFFQYLHLESMYFANTSIVAITGRDLSEITANDIAGFQEYLQQYVKTNFSKETDEENPPILIQNYELGIMRKLSCIRSYFEYLFRNEIIAANVATRITLPKRHEKPILYLEPEEVQKLIDTVKHGEGLSDRQQKYLSITKQRDIAILMLFLGTGIRVSELIGIDIDDLDLNDNAFVVTRKGGNQVILYYPDTVKSVLEEYLLARKQVACLPGHEFALFLSLQRRRMTARAVENMVKKYALIATPLKKRISPHKLRSTFGTTLYQETGDIYLVSDALGHSDVNTTKRHYASIKDSKRREAAQKITLPDV
ncbi:MAG: tyrosine-type recombinase/integrase [Clostridiales bacterium]|nr:tyrosine-type recombinase/integrase [Clostridiales bacterium]